MMVCIKNCKFATAMRRSVLSRIKGLFAAALMAAAVVSCENEKPEFIVPTGPVYQFFIESYAPDTVTVTAGDSLVLQFRTLPYNLFTKRDSLEIEIKDNNDADYAYARLQLPPKLGRDSIWSLPVHIFKGVRDGDAVHVKVTDRLADTVWRSAPIVLHKVKKSIENVTKDTLAFKEGALATFQVRTTPMTLLKKLPLDSITVIDAKGFKCEYADIKSVTMAGGGICEVDINIRYPMTTGDLIALKVSDPDTTLITQPVALKIIPKPDLGYLSLKIVSDSICGFLEYGKATVRFRTEPWNLLFDETIEMSLTDIDGYDPMVIALGSKEFQSVDSCWMLKIDIKDASLTQFDLRVRVEHPDTTMLSTLVRIEKVSASMSFVRTIGSNKMDYNSKTKTYSYCLPTVTDFSQAEFLFVHDGDRVTVGDSLLETGKTNILDARKPFTVSVWKYDIHQDYIIKLTNTGLPVVRITTPSPREMDQFRRDTWSIGAINMRIENPDGTVDYEGTMHLKGRGNGTWTETNKKPFGIKLDESAKILGMHKSKRWILLANYKDRTLMRNDAAFWLSRHTDMPYTINGQFVELVWNGKHKGNYYLCEQARIDNHRIDIHDPNLDEPANGGFFMEIDAFLDYVSDDRADKGEDIGFWSSGAGNRYHLPYIFKDPDEAQITKSSPAYVYMVNWVNNMEDAIYGLKNNRNSNWQQYLDMDRAIDYALIQEITMNHDSYNTWPENGPHSAFLYMDSAGVICFGPCWDFDYHTFTLKGDGTSGDPYSTSPRLTRWELLKMDNKGSNKYYFADLVKYDPQFKVRLLERWNKYKYVWKEGFPAYIDEVADKIRVSEGYNEKIWTVTGGSIGRNENYKQNGDWYLTFDEAVNNLKAAFLQRWQWMDDNLKNLPTEISSK